MKITAVKEAAGTYYFMAEGSEKNQ